ncbi:MAG: glycosyltransferase family 2 protein [Deltaproteobacteria bacterium]|nr:glycosyltransferase family 2 protein [Deltaproteobacteria bacterium]
MISDPPDIPETADPDLSVIVPLYNEEENVRTLCESIRKAVTPLGIRYEILLIDDGSEDGTFESARGPAREDGRIRIVKFRKNYGQTPALAAGIDIARGKILVTMDGDLQNDPADIGELLAKIREGYDIVCGWRENRQDGLFARRIPSWIANRLIGKITGIPIRDNGCTLKAYRADLIKKIPLYSEMHRFIPAMASMAGSRIAQLPVRHHARRFGRSKYGISRIYKILLDILMMKSVVSFAYRPMHLFALMGLIPGALCLLGSFSVILQMIYNPEASIVVLLGSSMLSGALAIFLFFSGALCELIYKSGNPRINDMSGIRASFVGMAPNELG